MGKSLVLSRKGRFRFGLSVDDQERSDPTLSVDAWAQMMQEYFTYQGLNYTLQGSVEEIGAGFCGLAQRAYKANGVVFACMLVRNLLFQEARFQFRQIRTGRPGDLFGTDALGPLEAPEPGKTTGDMLARALLHADLGGNWFGTDRYGGIQPLRPDWMTIVAGSEESYVNLWHPSVKIIGYSWQPGGPGSGEDPITFLPDEIAHFAPIPDPEARFRGMSWLTPVIREVMADKGFTDHKVSFLENGATPNLVVKTTFDDWTKMAPWVEKFREQHESASNAYKTIFLGAGQDMEAVGTDFRTLDLKAVQGAGETRIAAAAGVPPVIVGLSEGLEAATYSNYALAMRRFSDLTMRPLWRNMCGSLAPLIAVPANSELWYDTRDIAALRQDAREAAEVRQRNAATIASYIINGFEPDSAVKSVLANDESLLKHTGLVSVQLQEPTAGTGNTLPTLPKPGGGKASPATPAVNGSSGSRADVALDELLRLALRNREPSIVVNVPEQPAPVVHNHVDIPGQEPPVVNVTNEMPEIRMPDIDLPDVNVTVEAPLPVKRREVDFGDGRTAVITQETE